MLKISSKSKLSTWQKRRYIGVLRSMELFLAASEEITTAFGKQRKKNYQKGWRGHSDKYILTFTQPKIPKEIKIGYSLERIEQYILALLRWLECQRYGPSQGGLQRMSDMWKVWYCSNEIEYPNCQQNHPAFLRSCDIYKRERYSWGEV